MAGDHLLINIDYSNRCPQAGRAAHGILIAEQGGDISFLSGAAFDRTSCILFAYAGPPNV